MKGKNILRNKAGVSAIISVIFMVAITVTIAGMVYVYVPGMLWETTSFNEDTEIVIINGTLRGYNFEKWNNSVLIDDISIYPCWGYKIDKEYLSNFIGKKVIITFSIDDDMYSLESCYLIS